MSDQKIQTGTRATTNSSARIAPVCSAPKAIRSRRAIIIRYTTNHVAPRSSRWPCPNCSTAPGLGEDSGDGDRHWDSPHEESGDSDERPIRPKCQIIAERGADPFIQRGYEADLPDEKCARTGVLSGAGKVVNPMMIRGMTVVNSWIETSPPSVAPSISVNRAAIAAAGRSCGRPPAAGSAPRAADGRRPVPACAHRPANSSKVPRTTSHPDVVVPLCAATLALRKPTGELVCGRPGCDGPRRQLYGLSPDPPR